MADRIHAFQRMLERARNKRGAALMGVCNITPDSFSDGGRYLDKAQARARVDELISEGADIVDIGGESTRPGAPPVPSAEQLGRVIDAVRHAVARGAVVSVDTTDPAVAGPCLSAGAAIVNDVSCLRDSALARAVAEAGAALLIMHSRGVPRDMAGFSAYPETGYADVVGEVVSEWKQAAARALEAGVSPTALVMDPGLGFAKNARQSVTLLARLAEIAGAVGVPVAVGASRKSFLRIVDADAAPLDRLGASLAAALVAVRAGAQLLRVHDVRATRQALDLERELAAARG